MAFMDRIGNLPHIRDTEALLQELHPDAYQELMANLLGGGTDYTGPPPREGIESLFSPPSRRSPPIPLGQTSVGIDLLPATNHFEGRPHQATRRSPTGSFFSNLSTSPPGTPTGTPTGRAPFNLLGGGIEEQPRDQIFRPSPTPPPTAVGLGPETAPVDPYITLPDQTQPASRGQRLQQLLKQKQLLEAQLQRIGRKIQELQGGGRPPKDIGFTPLPQPPWTPPPGG